MNESTATRNVNKRVMDAESSAVVWKISDRFNAGRPDCHYLLDNPLYIEYKFVRAEKLPTRHTPALSPLQARELKALFDIQPDAVRVVVIFQIKKDLVFVEYTSPAEWENSSPIAGLQQHYGYNQIVNRILSIIKR